MQNWYEWRARAEIALYRGDQVEPTVEVTFEALRRSLLWRVQTIRMEALFLAGRFALRAGADAAPFAARVAKERHPFSRPWSLLLRAAIAARASDRALAAKLFEDAADTARAVSLSLCAAVADLAGGSLQGGAAGAPRAASGRRSLKSAGVRDPDRFSGMILGTHLQG
jgi:hypothetical protein